MRSAESDPTSELTDHTIPNAISVWASGLAKPVSGLGVLQREVYPRLEKTFGFKLDVGPAQLESGLLRSHQRGPRAANLIAQLLVPVRSDVALITTAPTPLRISCPIVGLVLDLRWRTTRGRLSRAYRLMDLSHLARRATRLIAISERTRDDLRHLLPEAAEKCDVVHLGPGQASHDDFCAGEDGTVLLVGGAPYKRNELAARIIAQTRPSWARRILGLGVSQAARAHLEDGLGPDSCEWYDTLDYGAAAELFRRSSTFVSLSTDEGFGLPYVEALASGCNVIAVKNRVTEEVLGNAGILIDDGPDDSVVEQFRQLATAAWPPPELRRTRSGHYSWDKTAAEIAAILYGAFARRP